MFKKSIPDLMFDIVELGCKKDDELVKDFAIYTVYTTKSGSIITKLTIRLIFGPRVQ